MKKKTVKLVSAVVVLGVLCAAYEGVNFYVTSQEEKETEENDTSVDLVSLEADDITAVSFTADQNEVEFDKKDDSWTEKSDANFPVNQDTVDSAVKGVAVIKYKPSKRSEHHSEIHGSEEVPLLSKSQRKKLAERAKIEYYEK